jgi:transposase
MPRAYSRDLRARVIAACEAQELTRAEIARQFDVAETTVYDWLSRWRTEGTLESRPHAGGHPSPLDRTLLKALVNQQNDRTLAEYADAYEQLTGRRYSTPRICIALQELGLSRKERRYALRSTSSRTSPPSA